jgi:hypothetical protein
MHPSKPARLFLQNHWGLYRSDDAGDSWQDIANGVPSDFGFAMTMHPHDPETVYIVPLESDEFRVLETVLRDAMDADPLNPAGVYFGTRSGKLFGSANGGASWIRVLDGLPPVLNVKAVAVGEPAKASFTKPRTAAAKQTMARRSMPAARRAGATMRKKK